MIASGPPAEECPCVRTTREFCRRLVNLFNHLEPRLSPLAALAAVVCHPVRQTRLPTWCECSHCVWILLLAKTAYPNCREPKSNCSKKDDQRPRLGRRLGATDDFSKGRALLAARRLPRPTPGVPQIRLRGRSEPNWSGANWGSLPAQFQHQRLGLLMQSVVLGIRKKSPPTTRRIASSESSGLCIPGWTTSCTEARRSELLRHLPRHAPSAYRLEID
jgi:hypothetical protein